jgi:hypothetical protein
MTQSSEPPSMADVGQADIFEIRIPPLGLAGTLQVPRQPKALVVFAHGSGSSRFSPRNMRMTDPIRSRKLSASCWIEILQSTQRKSGRACARAWFG